MTNQQFQLPLWFVDDSCISFFSDPHHQRPCTAQSVWVLCEAAMFGPKLAYFGRAGSQRVSGDAFWTVNGRNFGGSPSVRST